MDREIPPAPGDAWLDPDPDEPRPVELWSAVGDVSPWGTALLVTGWVAVFAAQAARGETGLGGVLAAWGASLLPAPRGEEAWRLLAPVFLHSGPLHLLMNTLTMLVFGPAVERIFGRAGFAVVFAAGAAASSAASLAWRAARDPDASSLSVGASGAIFALGGAVLVAAIRLRRHLAPGRARALGAALLFLIVNGLAGGLSRHGTDNAGHLGGLALGLLLGALLPLDRRLGGRGAGRPVAALGAIAALLLAAALALAFARGLAG